MSTSGKKCVLALKRQHLQIDEMEDGPVLNASMVAKIDELFEQVESPPNTNSLSVQNVLEISSDSSSSSSTSSDTSSESGEEESFSRHGTPAPVDAVIDSEPPAPGPAADTTVTEVVKPKEVVSRPESPQAGPSRYEDITFEPLITSTPIKNQEDLLTPDFNAEDIKNEMRDGKMLVAHIEFEILKEIRQTLKDKSGKHFSKLRERRSKVSKRMADLIKQRRLIDTLLESLSSHRDEIDDAIHKFNYMVENFPY